MFGKELWAGLDWVMVSEAFGCEILNMRNKSPHLGRYSEFCLTMVCMLVRTSVQNNEQLDAAHTPVIQEDKSHLLLPNKHLEFLSGCNYINA